MDHGYKAVPTASVIYLNCSYSTQLPRARAVILNCSWHCTLGIQPLRGSLRAAPIACVCGWTVSYRLTVSLRNSLPGLLLAGWVPLVTFFGRLLCGSPRTGESSRTRRIASPPRQGPVNRRYQSPDMTAHLGWCLSRFRVDRFILSSPFLTKSA